jgi:altronate dehydratase large subunit
MLAIQDEGGTVKTIVHGREIAARLAGEIAATPRAWCDIRSLVLSLKCGGSDYTSGLAANPALGRVADRLVDLGGSAVLGEIAEIMGAEHLLAARAVQPEIGRKLLRVINRVETQAMALGLDIRGTQPSPGNIRGGLTTIEEKSLGATHKGGEHAPLVDLVDYAGRISKPGLTVMDTPGLDVESVTGMVGGGAQVVVFTTGLGTPTGNPIAPVIKITGNARTAERMADNIDLDVSGVLTGSETIDAAADRLFDEVLAVASGTLVKAETLGHREFAIHRANPTI